MLKNYIKIAWRNTNRQKSYTLINVFGLGLGLSCALLIFAVVRYHFSFDNFHSHKDRIYRVVTVLQDEDVSHFAFVPRPLGKAIRTDLGFTEHTARVVSFQNATISFPDLDRDEKFIEETGIAYTEPSFFSIFNFPLILGNKKTLLQHPNEVVITERIAKKYFGNKDPMGKTLSLGVAANQTDYVIKGILKDIPSNTDFAQEIFVSYHVLNGPADDNWRGVPNGSACYTLLKPGTNIQRASDELKGLVKKYYGLKNLNVWNFKLQPLADIHFNPNYDGRVNKSYLWALSIIGLLLLLTAGINFTNLATAQAMNRSKEIGVRKVLGSRPKQLFWQFIAETAIIVLLATTFACIMAVITLPTINQLLQSSIELRLFNSWQVPLFLLSLTIFVTFVSGCYPGLIIAGFQPIQALQTKISQQDIGGFPLRRLLVIGQFAISQILIIGTIVIASQIRYAQQTDLGFNKEAIVTVPIFERANVSKMKTLRNRLSSIPGVEDASLNFQPPASANNGTTSIHYNNKPEAERWNINMKFADDQYLSTFGIKLIAGRNILPSDTVNEFLVNETFLKKLNLTSPEDAIGKKLAVNLEQYKGTIVGVIKDFYNYSFHTEKDPICIMSASELYGNCSVKLNGKSLHQTMTAIEGVWKETYPDFVYSYQFLDEAIAAFYEMDNITLVLIRSFALVAILIGCFGLYGLMSFISSQKTKEIGVRKILGASTFRILWIFGKEFTILLLIAFVIAAPVSWWVMDKFLADYTYRISIRPTFFVYAIAVTFLIAAVTVGYRSIKAALANPVDSLRNE